MHDVVIIGAGPAGLTAGLYCARYGLSVKVLERGFPGGQILLSPMIENYPGFCGKDTSQLIDNMKKQLDDLGVEIAGHGVDQIKIEKDVKKIKAADADFDSRAVIIASGAYPKKLGVAGEERLTGKGVSYCGTCDGPLFREREICVVGGGDRALEEALFLSRFASKVYLIHRRGQLRGSQILKKEARENSKIEFILESVVEEISGEEKVKSVRIKNTKDGKDSVLQCEGVFVFVGIHPNTGFLTSLLKLDKEGFIITDEGMHTSREGIFAAGDCRQKALRQVVTACADAAVAAYSANQFISPYK